MSPMLLKAYTDIVLWEWFRKCKLMGLKIAKNCYIHNLLFTNNQVVFTQGAENAYYMGRKVEEEYETKINCGKMKYLSTNPTDEVETSGNKIKTIRNFKYLGSLLQDNGSSDGEIEKRISKMRKVIHILNSILWRRNILQEKKKLMKKIT
jgi:hypothetical protein